MIWLQVTILAVLIAQTIIVSLLLHKFINEVKTIQGRLAQAGRAFTY